MQFPYRELSVLAAPEVAEVDGSALRVSKRLAPEALILLFKQRMAIVIARDVGRSSSMKLMKGGLPQQEYGGDLGLSHDSGE